MKIAFYFHGLYTSAFMAAGSYQQFISMAGALLKKGYTVWPASLYWCLK